MAAMHLSGCQAVRLSVSGCQLSVESRHQTLVDSLLLLQPHLMNPQLDAPHERGRLELLVGDLPVLHPPVAQLLPLQHGLRVVGRAITVGPGHGRQHCGPTTLVGLNFWPFNTARTSTLLPAETLPCKILSDSRTVKLSRIQQRSSISKSGDDASCRHSPAGTAGIWPDSGLQGPAHWAAQLSGHGSPLFPIGYFMIKDSVFGI